MICKVTKQSDSVLFDKIWMEVWDEKGFEHEYAPGDRYLIVNEDQPAGTVQFIPYIPEAADELHKVCSFNRIPKIRDHIKQVAIVDKVAISKPFRSTQTLDMIMYCLFEYAEQHDIVHFIALLDPLFYRIMRWSYHFPIEKAGGNVLYKGADVIPVIFDNKKVLDQKFTYRWYKKVSESMQTQSHSANTPAASWLTGHVG